MKQLVYNHLKEKKLLSDDSDAVAVNFLKLHDGKEVILSGNKIGLILLADYLVEIALAEKNTHIHLDESNFFDSVDAELIIVKTD